MARVYKTVGYKKRHYEDFARILGRAILACELRQDSETIHRVMDLFADDNPRFDHTRFMDCVIAYARGEKV